LSVSLGLLRGGISRATLGFFLRFCRVTGALFGILPGALSFARMLLGLGLRFCGVLTSALSDSC
jgi:hypothetical protein